MDIELLSSINNLKHRLRVKWMRKVFALAFLSFAIVFSANSAIAQVIINEIMVDVESGDAGDANGDGIRSFRGDEFIELVNVSANDVDISAWIIQQEDEDTIFIFPQNTIIQPGEFIVVFGGVDPTNGFGPQFPIGLQLFAFQQDAELGFAHSDGGSNLDSGGDNIVLRDDQGVAIAEVFWGSNAALTAVGEQLASPNTLNGATITPNTDQAITRTPDKNGLWAEHSTVGNQALFTPGAFNTGEFRDPPVGQQRFLDVNTTGQGEVTLDRLGGVYNDGTVVTLTATAPLGSAFDGWSGDASGLTTPLAVTMDANKTITANFVSATLPPVADANGPYISIVNSAITFSSEGSSDPDGNIETYFWDFGDGSTGVGANPSHTYTAPGNYIVTLTVTDNENASSSALTSAYITEPGDLVPLTYDGFEVDLGNFVDGGEDARLDTNAENAREGTNSARIQDNNGKLSSIFLANGIDARPFASIEIDFWYITDGMEDGEDFRVQFFDGSSWKNVAIFVTGVDSENGEFKNPKVIVNRADYNFAADMRVRFLNNASGNSDDVYIDEVRIKGVPATTHVLTTSTSGQGTVTLNSDNGVFVEGAIASVIAEPALGWAFDYWQGALSTSLNQGLILMNDDKSVTAVFRQLPADDLAPLPNPARWEALPSATSGDSITMTAVTAVDPSGVEYFFEETSGNPGGSGSGWQASPTYTDAGLDQGIAYTYRVRARDRSLKQNMTEWSELQSASTFSTPTGIDQEGPMMALAGEMTFTATASGSGGNVSWSVDRLIRNEIFGGVQIRESNLLSAVGESAVFDLVKIPGEETIYEVTASDNGFTETITVQVFTPDVRTSFIYESPGNPDVLVYIIVPSSLNPDTKVLSAHHGSGRGGARMAFSFDDWGPNNDYIVIVPEFDDSNWPGTQFYNNGNMFSQFEGEGELNPESEWSYNVAKDIAVKVLDEFGLNDDEYDAWGHSAGGQFVHRMMIFTPDAPIRVGYPANVGWWTTPRLDVEFPYGLANPLLSLSEEDVLAWTNRPMIIHIGENDTGTPSRATAAAAQGSNRFERSQFMFDRGLEANPGNAWERRVVPICTHNSACMAQTIQNDLGRKITLGDIDSDGDVDRDDIAILLRSRNQPADGSDDPKDLDGDGMITVLDMRKLQQLCTRPRCATE